MPESDNRRAEFVSEAFDRWRPRYLNSGLNYSDLQKLEEKIDSWTEWIDGFAEVAETHQQLGRSAEERGDTESLAEHFRRAALYLHFGSHVWHEDEEKRHEVHEKSVELFREGGRYLQPPVQRLEVPYSEEKFDIACNLRIATTKKESPLVILLPGLESSKEELATYEGYLLERGLSTLSVDGAGQGETWYHKPMSTDYPELISAVIDYVRTENFQNLDSGSIGVLGQSLGGFYAPFTATAEPRIEAVVSISGPFTVGPVSSWSSRLSQEHFLHACKSDSLMEVDDITERLTLRDRVENLDVPLLAVTGGNDKTVAPEQTQRIAASAPKGEFILYDDANHICNDIPYQCNTYVSDWLRSKLT